MFDFVFGPRKAVGDFVKQGIRLAEAVAVLEDDRAITITDVDSTKQNRVKLTIGMDA